jgi:hypothetical protein
LVEQMFVRLKTPMRVKAGWFAALLYLFCVLAPGAALALGDAASCLPTGIQVSSVAHVHDAHIHDAHNHDAPPMPAAHLHHQVQADQYSGAGQAQPAQHQHGGQHQHDGSPGPCCAMLCLSAIATDLPAVAKPSQPISVCSFSDFQRLSNAAPERRYRPPIA